MTLIRLRQGRLLNSFSQMTYPEHIHPKSHTRKNIVVCVYNPTNNTWYHKYYKTSNQPLERELSHAYPIHTETQNKEAPITHCLTSNRIQFNTTASLYIRRNIFNTTIVSEIYLMYIQYEWKLKIDKDTT